MPSSFELISGLFRIYNKMSGRSVIRKSRDSSGDGTAFSRKFLFLTRDLPYSVLVRRSGLLLCSLFATASGPAYDVSAGASTGIADTSPEGYSVSSEELPDVAMDAWYATVRVEGRGVSWPPGTGYALPSEHQKKGQ